MRPRPALAQDVGDPRGQHARLAGAGAGEHQNRAVQRLDRIALFGIEPAEILRAGCGPRTRGDAASRWLVLGDAAMGQFARLGHARIVLAPRWHREAVKGAFIAGITGHIGLVRPF
jgi:hypothetical protein